MNFQKSYRMSELDEVVSSIQKSPDVYISQSSFINKGRKTVSVGHLGAAFVDIDCYKLGVNATEQFASDVIDRATCSGIPVPSYIVFSGRGLYLKWLFTEPVSATNLYRWNALQLVLVSLYQSIGADIAARDASRVLRVMGSTNSASGSAGVQLAWSGGKRYDFNELSTAAALVDLPDLQSISAREARKHQARVRKLQSEDPLTAAAMVQQSRATIAQLRNYSARNEPIMLCDMNLEHLNWKRFVDLRDLAIMRGGINRGSRDLTLFWMGTFLAHSGIITPSNFESELNELSTCFPGTDFNPLEDGSMSSLFERLKAHQQGEKVVFNGKSYSALYTPTNETLIDIFEITPQEQAQLSTVIDSEEKRSRSDSKAPGRAERRQARFEWRFKATQLAQTAKDNQQDISITEIAREVGVHKTQVSRLLSNKIGGPRKPRARVHQSRDAGHHGLGVSVNRYITRSGIRAALDAARPLLQSEPDAKPGQGGWSYSSVPIVWPVNPFLKRAPDDSGGQTGDAPATQDDCPGTRVEALDRHITSPVVAVFSLSREEDSGLGGFVKNGGIKGFGGGRRDQVSELGSFVPRDAACGPSTDPSAWHTGCGHGGRLQATHAGPAERIEVFKASFDWPKRAPKSRQHASSVPIAPAPAIAPAPEKPKDLSCLSYLEHLTPEDQRQAVEELLQQALSADRLYQEQMDQSRAYEEKLRRDDAQLRTRKLVEKATLLQSMCQDRLSLGPSSVTGTQPNSPGLAKPAHQAPPITDNVEDDTTGARHGHKERIAC